MPRPSLEVADILRLHGEASATPGHLSVGQLKVMSAIEARRTAVLGGHVARCDDRRHLAVSYNPCRNRHCPKCQDAAARAWLAERVAKLENDRVQFEGTPTDSPCSDPCKERAMDARFIYPGATVSTTSSPGGTSVSYSASPMRTR